tara:strand:- start:119 stop:466 length:348 start_codon:yes stop_codon:yes gene_type:complete
MTYDMWNDETKITEYDVYVPDWISDDITAQDIASIMQGGCASGAYMPAVTYWQAIETMSKHGDDVLQFIQDSYGELPAIKNDESWSGIAVFFLSIAVELWAAQIGDELEGISEAA